MSEVLSQNVALVESLSNSRSPYPDKEAVYLIVPSPESIQAVLGDWSRRPLYAAAHLFFLSSIPQQLFDRIKASPITTHVKSIRELGLDFTLVANDAFTTESPLSFYTLYNPKSPSILSYELTVIAKRIVSGLVTLGEYPHIRYSLKCQELGAIVQRELDALMRDAPWTFAPARATLLLVDRSDDVLAPLLHEFTYQSMLVLALR